MLKARISLFLLILPTLTYGSPVLELNDQEIDFISISACKNSEEACRYQSSFGEVKDLVKTTSEGIVIERTWNLHFNKMTKFRLPFRFEINKNEIQDYVIPSVVYRENQNGKGKFLRSTLDHPVSFREDRVSLPSGAVLWGENQFISIFTEPGRGQNLPLSSVKVSNVDQEKIQVEIQTPWEEIPKRYVDKGEFFLSKGTRAGVVNWFKAKGDFSLKRKYFILKNHKVPERYLMTYNFAHRALNIQKAKKHDWKKINEIRLAHLKSLYYESKDKSVAGFRLGAFHGVLQRFFYDIIEFGFITKSMESARVFYFSGEKDKALATADFLISAPSTNGLFPTTYDIHKKKFKSSMYIPVKNGFSARMMGESLYQLVRLAQELKESDPFRYQRYLEFVTRSADFFVNNQKADGSFCKFWDKKGGCVDMPSTNGAYIVWTLIELWNETHDERYLDSAKLGLKSLEAILLKEDFFGDALDSTCFDKESGHALLRSFLLAYKVLPLNDLEKEQMLKNAKAAAGYVLSWMFLNDIEFKKKSNLGKLNFTSVGGTSVSVAHHHLDFYGPAISLDFLRLADASGDLSWKKFAYLMLDYSSQLIASKENNYLFTNDSRRKGWQPEQQYQTDWSMLPFGPKKGAFFNELAWVPALQLEAFLDLEKEFSGQY